MHAPSQGQTLPYAELEERANQLAHRLVALGVGPEVPVGVMMERSLDLIVALLGVLKAGGAYVPMDPSYPPDRLALMMEDCDVRQPRMLAVAVLHTSVGAHPRYVKRKRVLLWRCLQAPVLLSQKAVHERVNVPTNARVLLVSACFCQSALCL